MLRRVTAKKRIRKPERKLYYRAAKKLHERRKGSMHDRAITEHNVHLVLREARVHVALTQTELAERLGIPQAHVSRYETGQRRPRYELVDRVLAITGHALVLTRVERYAGRIHPRTPQRADEDS